MKVSLKGSNTASINECFYMCFYKRNDEIYCLILNANRLYYKIVCEYMLEFNSIFHYIEKLNISKCGVVDRDIPLIFLEYFNMCHDSIVVFSKQDIDTYLNFSRTAKKIRINASTIMMLILIKCNYNM